MTSHEQCRIAGIEGDVDELITEGARHASGEDLIRQGQAICQQAEAGEQRIMNRMRAEGKSEDQIADAVQAAFEHLFPAAYETCN